MARPHRHRRTGRASAVFAAVAMVFALAVLASPALLPGDAGSDPAQPDREASEPETLPDPGWTEGPAAPSAINWQRSEAIGRASAGRLIQGVQLPSEGEHFFTWDHVRRTTPNRGWRRYGTDRLVRIVLDVLADFRRAHPDTPRIGIGDLSRRHGGDFGPRFGGRGHASHQNGLDVDVYYPRLDGIERAPSPPASLDRSLSQDLVDRFVRAGAQFVFVGFRSGLRGPRRIVQRIPRHENHLHVRIHNASR